MGYWFDWVRFLGAAYLVWLGIGLIRRPVEGVATDQPPPPPRGGFFLQGFLVLLSQPEGAGVLRRLHSAIRRHEPAITSRRWRCSASPSWRSSAVTDAIYALLAGRARTLFSAQRTRLLSRISGGFMIGGGLWLALMRAR